MNEKFINVYLEILNTTLQLLKCFLLRHIRGFSLLVGHRL